ncbi:MAG: hypothetical protein KDC26_12905 [Armatimonadetes bacterium]|nr:hypothetical protein [Armatimonadota bacterium]
MISLLSLIIALPQEAMLPDKCVVAYEGVHVEYSMPNSVESFTSEFLYELRSKRYTILEDKEKNLTVIVSDFAYQIASLNGTSEILTQAAKLGETGIDTTTDFGKKASALLRAYDPFFDETEVVKQPIGQFELNLTFTVNGRLFTRGLGEPDSKMGYKKAESAELSQKFAKGEYVPKKLGPQYQVFFPCFGDYEVHLIPSRPNMKIPDRVETLRRAQELVNVEFEKAVETFRISQNMMESMLFAKYAPGLSNRIPGKISLSELPEELQKELKYSIPNQYSRYGFRSAQEAEEFLDSGGAMEVYSTVRYGGRYHNGNNFTGFAAILPLIRK